MDTPNALYQLVSGRVVERAPVEAPEGAGVGAAGVGAEGGVDQAARGGRWVADGRLRRSDLGGRLVRISHV